MSGDRAWIFEDDSYEDEFIRKYPFEKPWTQRDQGIRGADGTILVVLSDVVDVLQAEIASIEAKAKAYSAALDKATSLYEQADDLPWDEYYNWVDTDEDEYASEVLQDLLREAESIDEVYVDWNGDAGTVTISLSEYWEEFDGS